MRFVRAQQPIQLDYRSQNQIFLSRRASEHLISIFIQQSTDITKIKWIPCFENVKHQHLRCQHIQYFEMPTFCSACLAAPIVESCSLANKPSNSPQYHLMCVRAEQQYVSRYFIHLSLLRTVDVWQTVATITFGKLWFYAR